MIFYHDNERKVLNMVSIKGSFSKGWLARELDVQFDKDYYFDLNKRLKIDKMCNEFALNKYPELSIFYTESNLGQLEYFARDQILVGGIQPNMILGMLIGAEFIANKTADADISPKPLEGKNPDDLPAPEDLLDFELIRLFDEQIDTVRSNGKSTPIPPFFWDLSGRATIHGTLTTAQKYLGEDIFRDLLLMPDKVVKVLDWVTESFIVLANHFSEKGNIPITSIHYGECSGCMVGQSMFQEFVVPYASRIAQALGPLRFHSCGPTNHVLEFIKTIPQLSVLDLGGDTSISKVRDLLGKDFQIDVSPMPADMLTDSPGPILEWAQHIIKENADGPLSINYHLEPNYNINTVRVLCEFIRHVS